MMHVTNKTTRSLGVCCVLFVGTHHHNRWRTRDSEGCCDGARCEGAALSVVDNDRNNAARAVASDTTVLSEKKRSRAWRRAATAVVESLRVARAAVKLWCLAAPLMLLWLPAFALSPTGLPKWAEELAWRYALWATETAGPTAVKLAQWASSRDDRFPAAFCEKFSVLQDRARPHAWRETERALRHALGPERRGILRVDETPVGAGCVAQVHRAVLLRDVEDGGKKGDEVAVKVVHPGARRRVATDLALARAAARLLEAVVPSARWCAAADAVDEFALTLRDQMDMRREARNLHKFAANFKNRDWDKLVRRTPGNAPFSGSFSWWDFDYLVSFFVARRWFHNYFQQRNNANEGGGIPSVSFPAPRDALCSDDVLVEDFVRGRPMKEFLKETTESGEEETAASAKTRAALSVLGVDVVCKMIFRDNFLHGDMHPGNLLVTRVSPAPALCVLDAGIVVELRPADHAHFVAVLGALMRHDGDEAARLMIAGQEEQNAQRRIMTRSSSSSPCWRERAFFSSQRSLEEQRPTTYFGGFETESEWRAARDDFRAVLSRITDVTADESFFDNVGDYTRQIFHAAARCHVKLQGYFTSTAIAIRVMEGVASALDKDVKIGNLAVPWVVASAADRTSQRGS